MPHTHAGMFVTTDATPNSLGWSDVKAGGEGGIRTPDTLSGMPVFKTGVFDRSTTSPALCDRTFAITGNRGPQKRLDCRNLSLHEGVSVWVPM